MWSSAAHPGFLMIDSPQKNLGLGGTLDSESGQPVIVLRPGQRLNRTALHSRQGIKRGARRQPRHPWSNSAGRPLRVSPPGPHGRPLRLHDPPNRTKANLVHQLQHADAPGNAEMSGTTVTPDAVPHAGGRVRRPAVTRGLGAGPTTGARHPRSKLTPHSRSRSRIRWERPATSLNRSRRRPIRRWSPARTATAMASTSSSGSSGMRSGRVNKYCRPAA